MFDRGWKRQAQSYFLLGVLSFPAPDLPLPELEESLPEVVSLGELSLLLSEDDDDVEPLLLAAPLPDDFLA